MDVLHADAAGRLACAYSRTSSARLGSTEAGKGPAPPLSRASATEEVGEWAWLGGKRDRAVFHQDDIVPLAEGSTGSPCLRRDQRVSAEHAASCSAYEQNRLLGYGFLFPPGRRVRRPCGVGGTRVLSQLFFLRFRSTDLASSPESKHDAFLITNTAPMFPAFTSKSGAATSERSARRLC